MVKVTDKDYIDFSHLSDPQEWLAKIPLAYNKAQQKQVMSAFTLARELIDKQPEAEREFQQGLVIADVLIHLHVDSATLTAAMIFPFYHHGFIDYENLSVKLSSEIAELCKGVKAMDAIQAVQQKHRSEKPDGQQMDNFRRMLLAMVDDVRLVLIKLAERLCVLRQLKHADQTIRLSIAREVSDIYAPLANRLGVGQLKWEMEDLSFRYLKPEEYKSIAKHLDEKRVDRDKYVKEVLQTISQQIEAFGINNADLMGRAKHIYSIWKKMSRKNVGFEEIYDVRAVRILVDEVPECYAVLGIVHGLWKHIPKEFDDYIATPKENGYRSLHTAVIGPNGKTLEIQIRTKKMHQESELGVAAHWRYKEGAKPQESGFEAKINWLRSLLEWQEEVADTDQFMDRFRSEVVEDRIYVFTPQGKVVDLPIGATPVDFAYHVHTDVGHGCRGAKVGGRIVPLTYGLKTGQQVEILTTKNGQPSRDWLNPHNGYIRSSRARSKIHQWFRFQDKDKNAAAGRTIIDKDLVRHGLEKVNLALIARKFNFHQVDDLYAAVGAGDVGMTQVLNSIRSHFGEEKQKPITLVKAPARNKNKPIQGIQIEGVGNLLTKIAGCCRPVPGDDIVGYITQGRGVVVHRGDCNYILKARESRKERLIEVSWGCDGEDVYNVDLTIIAFDRKGLLKDITTVFANEKVGVEKMNSHLNRKSQHSNIFVRLNVENVDKLERVIAQLGQISNVYEVKRNS